eukprot:6180658-Pleurochrysis_carterae.AAC.4
MILFCGESTCEITSSNAPSHSWISPCKSFACDDVHKAANSRAASAANGGLLHVRKTRHMNCCQIRKKSMTGSPYVRGLRHSLNFSMFASRNPKAVKETYE